MFKYLLTAGEIFKKYDATVLTNNISKNESYTSMILPALLVCSVAVYQSHFCFDIYIYIYLKHLIINNYKIILFP